MKNNEVAVIEGTPEWDKKMDMHEERKALRREITETKRWKLLVWIAKKFNISICVNLSCPKINYRGTDFDIVDGNPIEK